MKWLSEVWGKASTLVQALIVVALVVVLWLLLVYTGTLDGLGTWLSGN